MALKGRRFDTRESIIADSKKVLKNIPKDVFSKCFKSLKKRFTWITRMCSFKYNIQIDRAPFFFKQSRSALFHTIRSLIIVLGRPPDLRAWIFGSGLEDDDLAILASAKSIIYRYFVQVGLTGGPAHRLGQKAHSPGHIPRMIICILVYSLYFHF
ncbi:hypothetical protein LAZ67_21001543 [Cordylochernes scorpioides]|uniref:Uncharacterized protein n=1 Tax=Cordylochernes scorpioides TaxID=51811 RepID=A0ABY6LPP9_9ARAC|nr:hypothetical protein LAZ67_21001543 [Cordylochernes scorpioides]